MNINQGSIVYVLRSNLHPDRYYTGLTDNVEAFEKYLKTGSGRAFSKRHFV